MQVTLQYCTCGAGDPKLNLYFLKPVNCNEYESLLQSHVFELILFDFTTNIACLSDYHRFMLVAESFSTVIFPFVWQHVYVPILPASLVHFLDAPVPFVMGLYCKTDEEKRNLILPSEV